MSKKNRFNISVAKFTSLILRHRPEEYGIMVDSYGFANLDDVLSIISIELGLEKLEILKILKEDEKDRFVFKNDKIASNFGHSIDVMPLSEQTEPPNILYHGTSPSLKHYIEIEGLKPMSRKFVHLSKTIEDAQINGKRKSVGSEPLIIRISAKDAYQSGIHFYDVGPLYLSEGIPGKFLTFVTSKNQ